MKTQQSDRAKRVFFKMEESMRYSLGAASVFVEHLLAQHQQREIDTSLLELILTGSHTSGAFMLREYLTKEGYQIVKTKTVAVTNQLVVGTWSLLEVYLKNKFEELMISRFDIQDERVVVKLLDEINLQGLSNVKKHFKKHLDIYLSAFEVDTLYVTDNQVIDSKHSSWERITLISDARNEIVHQGEQKVFGELYPSDVWNLYDFVRGWIALFDANINMVWYNGQKPSLIVEYEERVARLHQKKA